MFGIKHNECVGFDSRWSVKKVYYEGSSQTPLYVSKDSSTNPKEKKEMEVQTDAPPEPSKNVEYDVNKLADFLKTICPKVEEELEDGRRCRAFDNYKMERETEEMSTRLVQSIEVIPQEKSMEASNVSMLSSLSWNSTGKTVAISISYTHQSWCYDPGLVLLYTFDRNETLPLTPTRKINSDSCVTEIQFHPTVAYVLAGITHSSVIYLWNVQNGEDETVLVKISRVDNLCCLNWIGLDEVFLVTAGLDGIVTFWKFNNSYTDGNVYNRYRIKPPLMSGGRKLGKDQGVGVTCFDFSKRLPDAFIVGTEGGLVVRCSTSQPTKLKSNSESEPLYDPVYQYYQPHESSVVSVQFSRGRKDLFLTCSADRQMRIYVLDQEDPARVIFDDFRMNVLYWAPDEERLVFGYGSDGKMHVFDVITGGVLKIEGGDGGGGGEKANVQAKCIVNSRRSNTVVVGLRKGVLELWTVPWNTFNRL